MANTNILGVYSLEPENFIATDTLLFFGRNNILARTDGTVDGTFGLAVLNEDSSNVNFDLANSATIGDNLFLSASEDRFGTEVWVSDGTTEGTKILKDINPSGSSLPQNIFSFNETLLFAANDGVNGQALWRSDGTEAGTEVVKTFTEEVIAVEVTDFLEITNFNAVGDTVYFTVDSTLWRTDGTAESTQFVTPLFEPGQFTVSGNTLFFTDKDKVSDLNEELWISDGTEAGTRLLKDIFQPAEEFLPNPDSLPRSLTDVDGTLFFTAEDGVNGRELWKSDGTAEGTQLVKDIRPEERVSGVAVNNGSEPEDLINVDGTLFFTADDGVNGRELWKSDGTTEGTQLVKIIAEPDEITRFSDLTASEFVDVGGTLYFIAEGGLWRSDGTEAGTFQIDTDIDTFTFEPEEQVLRDLVPNNEYTGFGITSISEFNDQLFLTGVTSNRAFFNSFGLATLSEGENPVSNTVYRFLNPDAGVHFYTANTKERDAVQNLDNYVSEGESYRTVDPLTGGAEEVYRFFNSQTGVHLYTTSEDERDNIQATLEQFTFEGTAFYAYETQVEGSIPVYRFFEPTIGVHFYTPSETESTFVEENLDNYISEGIAYYALPLTGDV